MICSELYVCHISIRSNYFLISGPDPGLNSDLINSLRPDKTASREKSELTEFPHPSALPQAIAGRKIPFRVKLQDANKSSVLNMRLYVTMRNKFHCIVLNKYKMIPETVCFFLPIFFSRIFLFQKVHRKRCKTTTEGHTL
jgi:hypothetical protein